MASRGRDDDVRELGRGPATVATVELRSTPPGSRKRRGGPTVIALPTRVMSSPVTSTYPEDASVRSSTIEIGYTLRGSESANARNRPASFRVVSSRDLRDHHDRATDPRSGDLRHLREQGLVETVRVPGSRVTRWRDEGGPTPP